MYTGMVAPGVVNTMPEETLRAVADHAQIPADSVPGRYEEAEFVLDALRGFGIDYDDCMQDLEDEAVAKFEASWAQLGEHLGQTLRVRRSGKRG